jgi:hypothetical protein
MPTPAHQESKEIKDAAPENQTPPAPQPLRRLPGRWACKRLSAAISVYASWDVQDQFFTCEGQKSTQHVEIELETGEILAVRDIQPAKPASVRVAFPTRSMSREWLFPTPTKEPARVL